MSGESFEFFDATALRVKYDLCVLSQVWNGAQSEEERPGK